MNGSRAQLSALDSGLARPRRAFTLVELVVAAGITVLIAGFVAAIIASVSKTWGRSTGRLGADAQARIVLDQLQLDLEGALFRDDGNVWLAVDVLNNANGNSGTPWRNADRNAKPAGLSLDVTATRSDLPPSEQRKFEQTRYGTAGAWLRLFTNKRVTVSPTGAITSPSVPVAVSYQIVRRLTAANPANLTNAAYLLHRVEVRPVATSNNRPGVLEAGYNLTASSSPYVTASNNNNGSQPDDPRAIQVVTTNARNFDSVIADNVVDFGVRCYVRDSSGGLRLIFPALATTGAGDVVTLTTGYSPRRTTLPGTPPTWLRSSLPSNTPITATNFDTLFPDVIDVMVRILTDEGAELLRKKVESGTDLVPAKYNNNAQQWWWGVVTENSRVYTRRIVINARSS